MKDMALKEEVAPGLLIESKLYTTKLEAERYVEEARAGQVGFTPCPAHPTGGPLDAGEMDVKTYHRNVTADGQSHDVWMVVVRRRSGGELQSRSAGVSPRTTAKNRAVVGTEAQAASAGLRWT